MADIRGLELDAKGRPGAAAEIVTSGGTRLYLLPIESFPGHVNNVVLVDLPGEPVLFDVGTTISLGELEERFEEIGRRFGVTTRLDDVREAIVSHAHLDHFGAAKEIRGRGIPIACHELDARVIRRFEERRVEVSRDLEILLRRSGEPDDEVARLVKMYGAGMRLFDALEPDRLLHGGDEPRPGWRVIHVPGHSGGMIALAIDDVVLTADHLLAKITPAQFPEWLTPRCGLREYLASLRRLDEAGPFALGLGAHEAPIGDVAARIRETELHHDERLARVLELCRGTTVSEIARGMFGRPSGYGALLALAETSAHVEYLVEHGHARLENAAEIAGRPHAATRYVPTGRPLVAVSRAGDVAIE